MFFYNTEVVLRSCAHRNRASLTPQLPNVANKKLHASENRVKYFTITAKQLLGHSIHAFLSL